eukprot:254507_1
MSLFAPMLCSICCCLCPYMLCCACAWLFAIEKAYAVMSVCNCNCNNIVLYTLMRDNAYGRLGDDIRKRRCKSHPIGVEQKHRHAMYAYSVSRAYCAWYNTVFGGSSILIVLCCTYQKLIINRETYTMHRQISVYIKCVACCTVDCSIFNLQRILYYIYLYLMKKKKKKKI